MRLWQEQLWLWWKTEMCPGVVHANLLCLDRKLRVAMKARLHWDNGHYSDLYDHTGD